MDIKTEVKQEDCICSQKERELFSKSDAEVKTETEFVAVMKIDHQIEIKQEPCWLKTELCDDDIKDGDFTAITRSRLCCEAVSGAKSSLPSGEHLGKHTILYHGCETQEDNVTETQPVEEHVHTKLSAKYSNGNIYSCVLKLKQRNLIHKGERPHKCHICEKSFTDLSNLRKHNLIHEGIKPHKCEICEKSFTDLSNLRKHNLFHEGIKPHRCDICEKSFTQLSDLKRHNLIHGDKKPHKCKTCERSFTDLSNLKKHNFIHEGVKPHKCKICEKGFTRLSDLKRHHYIHGDKKPHKCKSCNKSFTWLSSLKKHNLIHLPMQV